MSAQPNKVLAIAGPTASGKTDLALMVAKLTQGEIINADSRQIYRGMDIGTAKPTAEQRAAVPHHLLDVVSPAEEFTLAHYVRMARAQIEAIQARGHLPILVGGTGLYLRAVLEGYTVPEVAPNPTLRARLEQQARQDGGSALLAQLQALDPVAAARIDPRNARRVIRALEVTLTLGVPFSSLQQRSATYDTLLLVLQGERSLLYVRADTRLATMMERGFEDEVRRLLAEGFGPDLPAMSALGYRELAEALEGRRARAEAIEAIRFSTHGFIRRQETWFRRERQAVPLDFARPDLLRLALTVIEPWLLASSSGVLEELRA